jgi:hypothetical protein
MHIEKIMNVGESGLDQPDGGNGVKRSSRFPHPLRRTTIMARREESLPGNGPFSRFTGCPPLRDVLSMQARQRLQVIHRELAIGLCL